MALSALFLTLIYPLVCPVLPTGLLSLTQCSSQPTLATSALLYPRANGSARKHCPAKHGAGVNPLEQYNTVQS